MKKAMRKTSLSFIYLVMVLGTLVLVQSCKKDNDGFHKYYATIQQYNGNKVHIDGLYSCWDEGDQIRLHGSTGTIGHDEHGYYISFPNDVIHGGESGGITHGNIAMAALYPASLFGSAFEALDRNGEPVANHIHLEPTQKYYEDGNGHQKLNAPMVAFLPAADDYTVPNTNQTMEFKNVCALLKVTVNTTTSITVTRIEVENTGTEPTGSNNYLSGRPLWGDFDITFISDNAHPFWQPILQEEADLQEDLAAKYITKEVTLECMHHGDEGGVSVSESHPFYIYLPPVAYHNLHVTVYAKDNYGNEKCTTLISNVQNTFIANTIYPLTVSYNENWTSVSRVHDLGPFTVNAQGKRVNFSFSNLHHDGEGYFFPPYQYDFIGYHDPNGDHDHFTSAQRTAILADPFATDNNWTMLTPDEWDYLLNDRGSNNTPRYIGVIVASVPGMILFPDNYPLDNTSLPTFAESHINNIRSPYSNNILSIPEFYQLEQVGCVFLPCVYYTNGDATSISDFGFYWENASWYSIRTLYAGSHQGEAQSDNEALIRLVKVIE